jgi:putative isomerase
MAQHCAFIIKYTDNTQWLEEVFDKIEKFLSYYEETSKHESGLFFFIDDFAIGVDTDPCTFFRPRKSSASIFLNTLMYKEYLATAYICERLGKFDKQAVYNKKAEDLILKDKLGNKYLIITQDELNGKVWYK